MTTVKLSDEALSAFFRSHPGFRDRVASIASAVGNQDGALPPTGEDRVQEANWLATLRVAGLLSRDTGVKITAETLDIEDVPAELARIAADETAILARNADLAYGQDADPRLDSGGAGAERQPRQGRRHAAAIGDIHGRRQPDHR